MIIHTYIRQIFFVFFLFVLLIIVYLGMIQNGKLFLGLSFVLRYNIIIFYYIIFFISLMLNVIIDFSFNYELRSRDIFHLEISPLGEFTFVDIVVFFSSTT